MSEVLISAFKQLDVELPADWQSTVETVARQEQEHQAWYIRSMIGFGAWIASLFFVGFVTSLSMFASESSLIVVGLFFILLANIFNFKLRNDFIDHVALAFSLAGQVLMVAGIADLSGWGDPEAACITLIVCNSVLFFSFRDNVHRFLGVTISIGSLVVLLYHWEQQQLLTWLVPVMSFFFAWLLMQQGKLRISYEKASPLTSALMNASFGIVLLSTFYILPELKDDFEFFPQPWVATVGVSLVTLFVLYRLLPSFIQHANTRYQISVYVFTLVIMLCSLSAPGIMFSFLVILLSVTHGHRVYTGIGMAFMIVFVVMYFYGIETSLLTKSYTLTLTGIALLAGRWWLKQCHKQMEQVDA